MPGARRAPPERFPLVKSRTEPSYPLGAVCRITGLTPHVLRVWERRYGAVTPLRTPKGTRRYRVTDVARLQLLRAAVEAGHRIGAVARLADESLQALVDGRSAAVASAEPLDRAIAAIEVLDAPGAERVISDQLLALGPVRFAREFALPLIQGVGARWFDGRLCIAAEHMASALLRSLLGAALRPAASAADAPKILFATLPGERHELGLLVSALVAMGAGANPIYLGAELPGKRAGAGGGDRGCARRRAGGDASGQDGRSRGRGHAPSAQRGSRALARRPGGAAREAAAGRCGGRDARRARAQREAAAREQDGARRARAASPRATPRELARKTLSAS